MTDLDTGHLRGATAAPGQDTRQWVSYGLVDQDLPNSRSVRFTDEDGNVLPYPVVHVTLQPSGLPVACRVASWVAGAGEGSWAPIGPGDEVLVLIPGGDEREGCVVVCRMNQGRDTFPSVVGGVDTTKNTTAFLRMVPPYIVESGTAVLLRVASNGVFLSLDQTGNATLSNSDNAFLAIHHDFVGLQTGDSGAMLQLNVAKKQAYLQGGSTSLLLDDGGQSLLLTQGTLTISTSGTPGTALGHAVTVEQVCVLLEGFLTALGSVIGLIPTTPLTPAALAAVMNPAGALAVLNAAIPLASALTVSPFSGALSTALSVPADSAGAKPGVGRPGLLL